MPTAHTMMRRDLLSAYAASTARIISWMIVASLVYRRSPEAFALLALVRGTIGILIYVSLGLQPAMIRAFAEARATPIAAILLDKGTIDRPLDYARPGTSDRGASATERVYATGNVITLCLCLVAIVAASLLGYRAGYIYSIPPGYDSAKWLIATHFSGHLK